MAEKKILTLTTMQYYDEKLKAYVKTKDDEVLAAAKAHAESLADNYDAAGTAATKVQELANGAVADNTAAIAKLNGDANTTGSVDKKIADAKALIDSDIDAVEGKADQNATDIAGIKEDLGNMENVSTTAKNVADALDELKAAIGTGGTAAVVTVTKKAESGEYAAVYEVKQGDTVVGTIDIPKDMVVQSGEVVTNPEGQTAGTYIKLLLANVEDPLYVNVGTLVDIYRAAANASQIQIAIDTSTREISATVVAGSITSTELDDNAVVTAKIADANVTKAKLAASVQASLDKADVAEANAKAYVDELNADMDERMQVVETALGSGEGSVADQIADAKQEAIDAAAADATSKSDAALAAAKSYAEEKDAVVQAASDAVSARVTTLEGKVAGWDAAEQNAKDFATGLNTAMDIRVTELEKVDHDHSNKLELDKIVTGDVAKWNAAQANAEKTASDALAAAKLELEGKIGTAKTEANAYTDGKISEVQQEINTNEENIDALTTRMGTAETDIDNLEARAAALETKIGDGFVEITAAEVDAMFA